MCIFEAFSYVSSSLNVLRMLENSHLVGNLFAVKLPNKILILFHIFEILWQKKLDTRNRGVQILLGTRHDESGICTSLHF